MNCHHSTVARLVERVNASAVSDLGGIAGTCNNESHIVFSHLWNRFQSVAQKAANTMGRRDVVDPGISEVTKYRTVLL